jgi:hypothetical protein
MVRISAAALIALLTQSAASLSAESWKAEAIHELDDIGLSGFLDEHLGLAGIDDHGIDLGGIGSDLWHDKENDGPGVYWMITDRGPNGEDPRTFPIPEFTPFIVKVQTANGKIEVLEAIPITGTGSTSNGVTGIANLDDTTGPPALNEPFFGCGGSPALGTNPHGLDTEGLVRTSGGTFWVVEEYSPSIVRIDAQGVVVKRYFPEGLLGYLDPVTGYATDDSEASIPEIFGLRRRLNRGFEGIALSPGEGTLYVALQSPFLTPTGNQGRDSRNTRILAFDVATERVVGEYVYRFQPFSEFNVANQPVPPFPANRARDMKLSALAMLDEHRMLVLERTDFIAKVYLVDLRPATNILGSQWDDPSASTVDSLEAVTDLEAAGITPLPKQLVVTLDSTVPVHGMAIPQKIEGLAVLDGRTIAIANDNDFGVGTAGFQTDGEDCLLIDSGLESQVIVIRLDKPLKK